MKCVSSRSILAAAGIGTLLAVGAQATVTPAVGKGQSVFAGWTPGGGSAGAWEVQYFNTGQPDGPTFNKILTEGNGRIVNTSAGDIDGDGVTEVIFTYNVDPVGHWMMDIDADGNPLWPTFTGLDQFGDGR